MRVFENIEFEKLPNFKTVEIIFLFVVPKFKSKDLTPIKIVEAAVH